MNSFKNKGKEYIDYVDTLFNELESYRVSPDLKPGNALGGLNTNIPYCRSSLAEILKEFNDHILPGINIWNHPGFMGYFNSSASEASVLAELLSAAVNPNCMNWKSCPAGTELEELTINWFRDMIGLPKEFWGLIYEGGSLSNFHGLAAARESVLGEEYRKTGVVDKKLRVYITNQTHSSIHKALIVLGIGMDNIITISVDDKYQMNLKELNHQIEHDKRNGFTPMCIVGTIGSTSCTAIDPVKQIGDIAKKQEVWFHIDASHAGTAAVVDKLKPLFYGWHEAHSIVINPHKWMFLSLDTSILLIKNKRILKNTFSIQTEYLSFKEEGCVTNYNDYGLTLGRKFKALKLWMNFKFLGIQGIRNKIKNHLRLASIFKEFVVESQDLELMAPAILSTVCFRYRPNDMHDNTTLNRLNADLIETINKSGEFFLTHTKLRDDYVIRVVISGYRVSEVQITNLMNRIKKSIKQLKYQQIS